MSGGIGSSFPKWYRYGWMVGWTFNWTWHYLYKYLMKLEQSRSTQWPTSQLQLHILSLAWVSLHLKPGPLWYVWTFRLCDLMRTLCVSPLIQYQLQWSSPWRWVSCQWQTWLVLITAFVLLGLVPYVVYCMMTIFTSPPPPSTFKVAAASFGLLTEILLIKWVLEFPTPCLLAFVSLK